MLGTGRDGMLGTGRREGQYAGYGRAGHLAHT
jgi:hypothetical protein